MKQRLSAVEKDLALSKEYLSSYIVMLYRIQNEFYSDIQISDIKLFSKTDDIASTLSEDEFILILTKKVQYLLIDLHTRQEQYESLITTTNSEILSYQQQSQQFEQDLEDLRAQEKEIVKLVAKVASDTIAAQDDESQSETALQIQLRSIQQ